MTAVRKGSRANPVTPETGYILRLFFVALRKRHVVTPQRFYETKSNAYICLEESQERFQASYCTCDMYVLL